MSAVPALRLTGLSERGWYGEIGSGPAMLMPVFHSAGIRSPNPGMNFASLRYTYRIGGGRKPLRLTGAEQH